MRSWVIGLGLVGLGLGLGCGGKPRPPATAAVAVTPRVSTPGERMLALLPEGAQLIVELDLGRLRGNPVVGPVVERVLSGGATPLPEDPGPADQVVLGAYGLGTAQAASVMIVHAPAAVPGGAALGDGLYALGPEDWVAQVEARAAVGQGGRALAVPEDLLRLRDRAMPPKATGAALRVTARLSFDARVALARITGLEAAPSRLSAWGDVADDLAVIVDADAADPGEESPARAAARLEGVIRGALRALAGDPRLRALGLSSSLAGAKLVTRGTWVRTIVAVGPRHLQRVVERALAALGATGASSS